MEKKNFECLSSVVKSIARNTFGVCVVLETIPRMRKTANPFIGRVTKVTRYSNVALGRDYYNTIGNKLDKLDLAKCEVEHEKPKGMTWLDYPYFLVSDKDDTQIYLRLTLNKNTHIVSEYYLDGVLATDDEVALIKTFIQSSGSSAKQTALGIDDDEQVKPFSPKVEGIKCLWQGDKKFEV